ncbi:DUF3302 domain-containing protein [Exercitatus varius]|uniref:DUF3302 domain-containing protein n=1 Tax=Exercitatus varius TaxID=67857 RepID=UPI00374E6703
MLDYLALFFLLFACIVIFYAVIAIHDIPYEIAKKRNHPHLEAIHYAGWVSLFTLHVIWPFLWIWATLWHKENGWGNGNRQKEAELFDSIGEISKQLPELEKQNLNLETELATLRQELNVLTQKITVLENNQRKDEV